MNDAPENLTSTGELPTVTSSRIRRVAVFVLFSATFVVASVPFISTLQEYNPFETIAFAGPNTLNRAGVSAALSNVDAGADNGIFPGTNPQCPNGYYNLSGEIIDRRGTTSVPPYTITATPGGTPDKNRLRRFQYFCLKEGHYTFRITDITGQDSYSKLYISKDGLINFMFVARTRTQTPPKMTGKINAAPKVIKRGESTEISWSTKNAIRASVRAISPEGRRPVSTNRNGSEPRYPTRNTTYELRGSNSQDGRLEFLGSVPVTVICPPPTATFLVLLPPPAATEKTIEKGKRVTLSWTTENASSVRIDQRIGPVAEDGNIKVNPQKTTTYLLTASKRFCGEVKREVTVTVSPTPPTLPTAKLAITPECINTGENAKLEWTTGNATSVRLNPGDEKVGATGKREVNPKTTTTYTITATKSFGFDSDSATLTVPCGEVVPPEADLIVTPQVIKMGEAVRLDWNTEHADLIKIDKEIGGVPHPFWFELSPAGNEKDIPFTPDTVEKTVNYILTAIGADGREKTVEVLVTVTRPTNGDNGPDILPGLIALAVGAGWYFAPELARAAGGNFGGIGVAGTTSAEGDEVHCTLYSPAQVGAGTDLLVQIFAHLLEQAEELEELAQELEPDAKKQRSRKLKKPVKRESVLTFKLTMPGILPDEEEEDIVWDGEPEPVEFIIPIPEDHAAGKRFGKVFVYNNGEEIGKISFVINILSKEVQPDPSAVQPTVAAEMTQDETAFISYASRDKDRVYPLVKVLDLIKYQFDLDIFSLEAGDRWEQKLYEFIDKNDVFLLFWSDAASQSEWVIKEAQLAKDRMTENKGGLPRIVIYKLDEKTQVPEFLEDIHVDRKWATIIENIESQKENAGASVG